MSETRTSCIADNSANKSRVAVILPVRNAGDFAKRQVYAFKGQIPVPHVMVIDSKSTDGSPDIYRAGGCEVIPIAHKDFDHGATRNFPMTLCDADIIIFMTHNSILQRPDSIFRLCAPFADPAVGVVYGRQPARPQARAIERHARYFNYPAISSVRTWPSARRLGIRAAFNSNTELRPSRRRRLRDVLSFASAYEFEKRASSKDRRRRPLTEDHRKLTASTLQRNLAKTRAL